MLYTENIFSGWTMEQIKYSIQRQVQLYYSQMILEQENDVNNNYATGFDAKCIPFQRSFLGRVCAREKQSIQLPCKNSNNIFL